MASLADRSEGLSSTLSMLPASKRNALRANISDMGFFLIFDVYASMACTIASIPVMAVAARGKPRVSSASSSARSGSRTLELTPALVVAPVVITATGVTSDPVPAVVGTSTRGKRPERTWSTP